MSLISKLEKGQGLLNDLAYGVVKSVSDLTPETKGTTVTDHVVTLGSSAGETVLGVGQAIKQSLWDDKNVFVQEAVKKAKLEDNPALVGPIALTATAVFYGYKFTVGLAVDVLKGVYHGGKAIANASNTESALMGVAAVYGSIGAASAAVAGGVVAGRAVLNAESILMFPVPVQLGNQFAYAGASYPAAGAVGAAVAGMTGNLAVSVFDPSGTDEGLAWQERLHEDDGSLFRERVSAGESAEVEEMLAGLEEDLSRIRGKNAASEKAEAINQAVHDLETGGLMTKALKKTLLRLAERHRCLYVRLYKDGKRAITLRSVIGGNNYFGRSIRL